MLPWEVLGRYLGGTWEERFRFTFATSLLSNRCQSEGLSKSKRSSIEHLSNIYRTSIEHLSNIYRRPIEDLSKTYRISIEDLSNIYRRPIEEGMCQLFYPPPIVCLLRRIMGISPSIFLLTDIFLLAHLKSVK